MESGGGNINVGEVQVVFVFGGQKRGGRRRAYPGFDPGLVLLIKTQRGFGVGFG